jgi:outer membrane protein
MNIRKLAIIAVMALAYAFTSSVAEAQTGVLKIGYVSNKRLEQEYKAFAKADTALSIEIRAWEEEGNTKQMELQQMLEDYEKQKLILSEEKKREREAAMRAKNDALDAYVKQVFGPGGQKEQKQRLLLQPLIDNVTKAIQAIAVENGYDAVFTLESLAYIKDGYDITDKVLEYLARQEQ